MNRRISKSRSRKYDQNRRRAGGGVRQLFPFLLLLLIIFAIFYIVPLSDDCREAGRIAQPGLNLAPPAPPQLDPDDLYSQCALLIRRSDGTVLFEKNSTIQAYPASLTKMMTAYTFLSYCREHSGAESDDALLAWMKTEQYTLPAEIFPVLAARHASMAGLQPGETVTLLDLLYACHLPSGADGSMGLAYYAAGSEEAFTRLMNEKARELGMSDTHFANVTGLHDPQHYSTAQDLFLLLNQALKDDVFREIFTAREHRISPTNLHPEGLTVPSTLFYKMDDPVANRCVILGGKTGYTEEAGQCLASLAKKGSQEYILITMGAPGNNYTAPFHILDAKTVYSAL